MREHPTQPMRATIKQLPDDTHIAIGELKYMSMGNFDFVREQILDLADLKSLCSRLDEL
jgi:hypothetical protein